MVAAVRRGAALRAVARRFHVSVRTVHVWVERAAGRRLDQVDWRGRAPGCRVAPNRTPAEIERWILQLRDTLRHESILGEYGAATIHATLQAATASPVPAIRTISRILVRHGRVDRRQRVRRPPPPPGWYLPEVAAHRAEVDLFDVLEDLKLERGPLIDVLTGVSLHGGLPAAWPLRTATTSRILPCLRTHWQAVGCPAYAQFDNDTRFQGAHQHPDVFGRVVRQCLQLGITPVFVPPREFGLQNPIEHFNGLFTAKVWRRFFFPSLAAFHQHTLRYLTARRARLAARIGSAPPRAPWSAAWRFRPAVLPPGRVIFVRRTTARGTVELLGHTWPVDRTWCHRLVRVEVALGAEESTCTCYALRRNAPTEQPLLAMWPYHYPRGPIAS